MTISYADACLDPDFFGPWFDGDTWDAWRVLDKAIFGDALDPDELDIFKELTGRTVAQTGQATEVWAIAGRRSGKDVKAASIVTYLATIGNEERRYTDMLTPGERGVIQLLAVDRYQAVLCLGYIKAMLEQPLLAGLVKTKQPADGIELTNGLIIEVTTNDKRRVRGRTVIACVLDEVAYWMSSETSVNPDTAVYDALKPAMATIAGSLLIGISSPYAHRGLLYDKYKKHYGKNTDDVLIVKAPTWIMNSTLSRNEGVVAEAYGDDPQAAAAEYGAEFRSDVAEFVPYKILEACITKGVYEILPKPKTTYVAFTDPSGGSSDSFTLAIAHAVDNYSILDCVREIKAPFKPTDVVAEFCTVLKTYGLTSVTGDRYAGQWVVEAFAEEGIEYIHSTRNRSELYLDLLPRLNSGSARLLDVPRLLLQLIGLERRTSRSGRDSVDHGPSGHDDIANSVAGAITLATEGTHHPVGMAYYTFASDRRGPAKPSETPREKTDAVPLGVPPPALMTTARLMSEEEAATHQAAARPLNVPERPFNVAIGMAHPPAGV